MHHKSLAFQDADISLLPGQNLEFENHPNSLFLLAKIRPSEFVEQLNWNVSSNIDDMFLEDRSDSHADCFNSKNWIEAWLEATKNDAGRKIQIVTGSIAGNVIIALPLVLVTRRFYTSLEYATQEVSDYNMPVIQAAFSPYFTHHLLECVYQKLQQLFPSADCLVFRKCLLEHSLPERPKLRWFQEADGSHLCELNGNWKSDFERFVGKSSRRSLKRKMKKLETFGEVTFQYATTDTEKADAVSKLLNWKQLQLESLGAASKFENSEFRSFIDALSCSGESERTRFYTMRIKGEIVAVVLMLLEDNHWFLYQTAYSPEEVGKYSPGYFLMLHIMESASKQDAMTFDFGWGNEPYKARFATRHFDLFGVIVPYTMTGYAVKCLNWIFRNLKERIKSNNILRKIIFSLLAVQRRVLASV